MYDFFDKHGKKLLAIVGSFLMVAFLLPGSFGRGNGGTARLGTVNGHAIGLTDVQSAHNALVALDRLRVKVPDRQTGQETVQSLPAVVFQNADLARGLESNSLQWYLLVDEAARNGASASESVVESVFTSQTEYAPADGEKPFPADQLAPAVKDDLRAALRQVLAVTSYFGRGQDAIKISRPLVDDLIARQLQQLKARVAVFDAADYAAKVAAPTADELKRQFDAYADTAPKSANDADPFGFGYCVPDRVAVQYLTIADADVAKVVDATQSAEKWGEDAMVYYRRNLAEFQTTGSATTQPTTRPFADAASDADKKVHQPFIDALKRKVATAAAKQIAADAKTAGPSTQPSPDTKTASGVAIGSADYLNGVADAVARQTGVRPTVTAVPGLLDRTDVRMLHGLGNANPADAGQRYDPAAPADTADYLFGTLKPFVDAAATQAKKNTRSAAVAPTGGTLDVLAPSKILRGSDAVYVVRATQAVPAHAPAAMDDVKDRLDKDVRRAKAYALAQAAAEDAQKQADAVGGLAKVIGLRVQTTDWFGTSTAAVPGLTGDFAPRLIAPAFDTLKGLNSPADLPKRTVVKLRSDDRAAVVEVFDVKTTVTDTDAAEVRSYAERSVAQSTVDRNLFQNWFSMDGVSRRVNYTPDASEKPSTPSAPRQNNPFTP